MHYHKLGVFGGTFNPVHVGHLRLAEDVREEFYLDAVVFIPTNIPPHKNIHDQIDSSHRLKMVQNAVTHNEHFLCDDVEIRRGGISYTIDTIDYIYGNYHFDDKPYFIVGSDLIADIESWKNIGLLVGKIHFIVLLRGQKEINTGAMGLGSVSGDFKKEALVYYRKRRLEITSSEIRERIKSKKSIRYLVTDEVFHYIHKNKLYQN
jgi:nicotinate-nucleotide adenylyltransferase